MRGIVPTCDIRRPAACGEPGCGRLASTAPSPLRQRRQEEQMTRTGLIDHIGIGVPDLAAAKRYYDELMPILGLRAWFATTPAGEFNYGPDGARGSPVFFYQAVEPRPHSRHGTGLQHLSFMVPDRATVREAHDWAVAHDAEVIHEPREFPEYGEHYATYFLDPHGFMLEVVCHSAEEM
jgi:catechol 2,3-dioxygenase-like lactoylglutathione lyase family enzyme